MTEGARAWLALGLEVVFFASAFGWRTWIQWRRTGSTGFVVPGSGDGPAERAGSVAFVVALVLLVAAPIAALAGLDGFEALEASRAAAAGILLGVGGIGITLAAQMSMGASWRIGVDPEDRTELITTGIFSRVRNPIFTAMLVASIGLALLVPNLLSVAAVAVLVAGLVVQVRLVEEPHLRAVHGERYLDYQRRTGRFIPTFGDTRKRTR